MGKTTRIKEKINAKREKKVILKNSTGKKGKFKQVRVKGIVQLLTQNEEKKSHTEKTAQFLNFC